MSCKDSINGGKIPVSYLTLKLCNYPIVCHLFHMVYEGLYFVKQRASASQQGKWFQRPVSGTASGRKAVSRETFGSSFSSWNPSSSSTSLSSLVAALPQLGLSPLHLLILWRLDHCSVCLKKLNNSYELSWMCKLSNTKCMGNILSISNKDIKVL